MTPQLTIYDYFRRACVRPVEPLAGVSGARQEDEQGNSAVFAFEVGPGGLITVATYRATSCATLLGACEYLAEFVIGSRIADVLALTPGDLGQLYRGVPAAKYSSLELAIAALQSAARALAV